MENLITSYKQTAHYRQKQEECQAYMKAAREPLVPVNANESSLPFIKECGLRADTLIDERFHWFVKNNTLKFLEERLQACEHEDMSQEARLLLPKLVVLMKDQRVIYGEWIASIFTILQRRAPYEVCKEQRAFFAFLGFCQRFDTIKDICSDSFLMPKTWDWLVENVFNGKKAPGEKEQILGALVESLVKSEQLCVAVDFLDKINPDDVENSRFLHPLQELIRARIPQQSAPQQQRQQVVISAVQQQPVQRQTVPPPPEMPDDDSTVALLRYKDAIMNREAPQARYQNQNANPYANQYTGQYQQQAPSDYYEMQQAMERLQQENAYLRQTVAEQQATLATLETPMSQRYNGQNAEEAIEQLHQTQECFDRLMEKYRASRDREEQLQRKLEKAQLVMRDFRTAAEKMQAQQAMIRQELEAARRAGGGTAGDEALRLQLVEKDRRIATLTQDKIALNELLGKFLKKYGQKQ